MFRKILFSSCLILINFQSAKSETARCWCENKKLVAIRNATSILRQVDNKPGDGRNEWTTPELTDYESRLFHGPSYSGYQPLKEDKVYLLPTPGSPRQTTIRKPTTTTTNKPRPPPKQKPPKRNKSKNSKHFDDVYSDDEPPRPGWRSTKTRQDVEEKNQYESYGGSDFNSNVNENVNQVKEEKQLNGGSKGARSIVAGISLGGDAGLGGVLESGGSVDLDTGLGGLIGSSGAVGLGAGLAGSSEHDSSEGVGLSVGLAGSPHHDSSGGVGLSAGLTSSSQGQSSRNVVLSTDRVPPPQEPNGGFGLGLGWGAIRSNQSRKGELLLR